MQILITNNTLAGRAGSELYVRDLAIGLLDRGHAPSAYSTRLGEVAWELQNANVQVVDDLDALATQPDIIHGHHHLDTMTALMRFPGVPAIFVSHGSTPWEEAPPHFPRIRRYVAVDHACRDRLIIEHGIPEQYVRVVLNFVDLERFKPGAQLSPHPRRGLIFSNQATEDTCISAIRSACARAGMDLDVIGKGVGKVCAQPEALLGNYDIVFAKGRAALEALAVGSAVVLCDAVGAGPMVTTGNVERLRPLNFGIRALTETVSRDVIAREIARYDPTDAARVSEFIRASAGREAALDELVALYQDVIDEHLRNPHRDIVAEQHALASYLHELSPRFRELSAKGALLDGMVSSRSWQLVNRYMGLKRKFRSPDWLSSGRSVIRRVLTARNGRSPHSAADIFSKIYQRKAWGDGESLSGPGSSVERSAAFKDQLVSCLTQIKAESLLDAGCGDFNWMRYVDLGNIRYIGIDVVAELVSNNVRRCSGNQRSFVCLDMTKDDLPQADVVLCRDSLVHLPLNDIAAALANFKRSGATYLLATTFTRFPNNRDIVTGDWRQLNLQKAPFNFPQPLMLIDEKCHHSGGIPADKYLGLWTLADIPISGAT